MTIYILSNAFILARDNDAEGWINLLIPVVVAIFWAINALAGAAKAKQQKTVGGRDKGDTPGPAPRATGGRGSQSGPAQPARSGARPPVVSERRPRPPKPQPPRRPMPRPQQNPSISRRPGPAVRPVAAELTPLIEPAGKPSSLSDQARIDLLELQSPSLKKLDIKGKAIDSPEVRSERAVNLAAEYDDPERLRMAILHSVILGKPKSMEDPDE